MADLLTALLLLPALFVAFVDWRKGLFACVVVALLQDPLRKLTPSQPVYFVVLVGVVLAAAWLGAFSRIPLRLNRIVGWQRSLGVPFTLFLMLVIVQAAHAYLRYGNPMLPAIGLLSYLAPLPALILGYQFAARTGVGGVERWLWFYLITVYAALSSVYFQYAGLKWPIFGEVGPGVPVYDKTIGLLPTYSGLFRATEIAAWHASTAACVLFLVGTERRLTSQRILVALAALGFLAGIGLLTGRRKMLVEIAIFMSAYLFLIAMFRKGGGKVAAAAVLAGILVYVGAVGLLNPDPGERQLGPYQSYVNRGKTVFEDIPRRLNDLGIAPVAWAVNQFGLFGAGLGTGSQGTQHFRGGAEVFGGAGEGGLGKITMELGVPGLPLVAWLAVAMARHIWRILVFVSARSVRLARLSYGFLALLVANGAVFSVATQVFGDVFVLLILGLSLGFLLAMPVLAEREGRGMRREESGVRSQA